MLTFGDRLRAEREKRSIGLDEIAASTRIHRRHLEALERNEFGELPGPVFNRGYVRAYAAFLHADPEPLLRAYNRELRVRELPEEIAGTADPLVELRRVLEVRPARFGFLRPRGVLTLLALCVGLALLALVMTSWLAGSAETPVVAAKSPPALSAPAQPEPKGAAAPEPVAPIAHAAAEPIPAPAPAKPPPRPQATLGVPDFGVGGRIVDRVLVNRTDRFEEGTEAWFWTLVVGGRHGDTVRHVWIRDGRVARSAELSIGGSRWRTYSRMFLPLGAVGSWTVEARDASGTVLARAEFLVSPRAAR